jgi:hypothetical protein
LTLPQLYVVAFLVGTFTVFFDVSYQSYLPSLVERRQIIEGNSKLEVSRTTAQISGPGVAGGLIGLITAPYAVLVDAISFLGSGLFLLGIRKHEEPPARETADGSKPSLWTELKEGLRFVLGNPNLRAQAGCTGTSNLFFSLAFSDSSSRRRLASLAFMPPYWLRQRFQLDSDTSRCRSTSVRSLPSLSRRSPSRSLRTICWGV